MPANDRKQREDLNDANDVKLKLKSSESRSERVYQRLKNDIFDFKWMPAERLTESELAAAYAVSRTPIRQALYRLQQEGYVEVSFRSGWQIRPLNFQYYEQLYDVRILLEQHALQILCQQQAQALDRTQILPALQPLFETWMVKPAQYLRDLKTLSQLDEDFHCQLLQAAGNSEMARIHLQLSEKIRIIRRLDFLKADRISATYIEHQQLLQLILAQDASQASAHVEAHIRHSRDAVKQISLEILSTAQYAES